MKKSQEKKKNLPDWVRTRNFPIHLALAVSHFFSPLEAKRRKEPPMERAGRDFFTTFQFGPRQIGLVGCPDRASTL